MNAELAQETMPTEAAAPASRPRLRLITGSQGRTAAAHRGGSLSAALERYEIGETIGRGSFGVVYKARHRALGRDVAVKQLWPDLMRNPDARTRFAVEARLMASLDHPHVVRVYDYVDDGACALVLEHMPGGTLHDRMSRGRPVLPAAARAIGQTVLSALEHAHARGFIHRDVKPKNLLFSEDGTIKLADFGLAMAIGPAAAADGGARLAGTPAFMAPEQIDRALGTVSPATDVWAVGALLYEMLAARPVFSEGDDIALGLLERVSVTPPPLCDVARGISTALSDVIDKALARLPECRFRSAAEFADALEQAG